MSSWLSQNRNLDVKKAMCPNCSIWPYCVLGTSTATVKLYEPACKLTIWCHLWLESNDDDHFGNVVPHVEIPHSTAQASIIDSTAHATVETTSSSNNSLLRKPCSCMPAVTVAFVNMSTRHIQSFCQQLLGACFCKQLWYSRPSKQKSFCLCNMKLRSGGPDPIGNDHNNHGSC